MYVTSFKVLFHRSYPRLVTDLYEKISVEWKLPSVETLHASLSSSDVQFPPTPSLRVHVLDNLLEKERQDIFQVRFLPHENAREPISVFVSLSTTQVMDLHVSFPGISGRQAFSKMLQMLIDLCGQKIRYADLRIEIEGFSETDTLFIRESNLGAFNHYDAEHVHRYLHQSEHPDRIRDARGRGGKR